MLILKIALRTLLKRKGRMALIGALTAFGTFLIVFGGVFASSAEKASREAIIGSFTGDFIVYSAKSKELPSPFAFNTPLPKLADSEAVARAIAELPGVEAYAFYAQNYGIVQADREGKKIDLPFIFYAVESEPYSRVFSNVRVEEGSFFGAGPAGDGGERRGILISRFQNERYRENYGVELRAGEELTLLGVTEGGVNAARSRLLGLFEPERFKSVFDYINFMDADTYAELYSFTGVEALPDELAAALDSAGDEESIFALADDDALGALDVDALESKPLSGFTMAAVRMSDRSRTDEAIAALEGRPELDVKVARWREASGFYARIAEALQVFIYLAVALIFLVVAMIFMNTLIINVVERTSEIGTMRAIGADKSFIRGVFLAETLTLNLAAALAAMVFSAAPIALGAVYGIPLPETVSQFLIGGGSLTLRPEAGPFVLAALIVAAVSVLATLYPVRVATTISPLKAMSGK